MNTDCETEFPLDGFRRDGSGELSLDISQAATYGRLSFTIVLKNAVSHEPPEGWDDDYFFVVLLEMEREEREERERMGILGCWPFWKMREWVILHPERAEQFFTAGILLAGVTLGVLWHVLSPRLAWLWPQVLNVSAFVGGTAAP